MKNSTDKIVGLFLVIMISFWIVTNEVISLSRDYNYTQKVFEERIKKDAPDAVPASTVGEVGMEVLSQDDNLSVPDTTSKPQLKGEFSAYTSRVQETDNTPFITADGTDLRIFEGCVVASKLPFGTKIEIEGFGVCEVHDRMNSRYSENHFDIHFKDLLEALKFGRKELEYSIL